MSPREGQGRCLVTFILKCVVVQSGIIKLFEHQCLVSERALNQNRSSICSLASAGRKGSKETLHTKRNTNIKTKPSYGRLTNDKFCALKGWAVRLNQFSLCLYWFTLLKYSLLEALKLKQLDAYKYLDCYIFGRFRFFGRTSKMSNAIVMLFVIVYMIYRYVVGVIVPKQFRFYALEFLFNDYEEVIEKSVEFVPSTGAAQNKQQLDSNSDRMKEPYQRRLPDTNHQFRFPFDMVSDGQRPADPEFSRWVLRPNRTLRCWLILSFYTKMYAYFTMFILLSWLGAIYYANAGYILTNTGFELAYGPACLDWIRREHRKQLAQSDGKVANVTLKYASIYTPPDKMSYEITVDHLPAVIPLVNVTQFNGYNTLRVIADLIENHYWYIEFGSYYVTAFYLVSVATLDIILNAREIKRRLARLVKKLAGERASINLLITSERPSSFARELYLPKTRKSCPSKREWEISTMQAVLVDHFQMIDSYNVYLSFLLACLAAIWVLYTIIVCVWMILVKSRALEVEFALANCGSSIIIISFLGFAAAVRSQTRELYPLIASAMALDRDETTKRRWMTIVRYFYPKTLYCFTLLNSVEISWLFCLKVATKLTKRKKMFKFNRMLSADTARNKYSDQWMDPLKPLRDCSASLNDGLDDMEDIAVKL